MHTCGVGTNEVKKTAQAGWSEWRRVSGVICKRRVARINGKAYKLVVRPNLERVALTKRQETKLVRQVLKTLVEG